MDLEKSMLRAFGTRGFFDALAYEHMCKSTTSEFVIFPFFVETLLTLMQLGATKQSREELEMKTEGLFAIKDEISKNFKDAVDVNLRKQLVMFRTPCKVFVNKNYKALLDKRFELLASHLFRAAVQTVDFSTPEGATIMNLWTTGCTDDKIATILDPESSHQSIRAVLVNPVYFKGVWKDMFMRPATSSKNFYKSRKEIIAVETMRGRYHYNYCESEELDARLLEMPCIGTMTMTLVLPNDIEGLADVEKKMGEVYKLRSSDFTNEFIDAEIPKFCIQNILEFKEAFEKCSDFQKTFRDDARIGDDEGLYINRVIHKLSVLVDEEGIDAGPYDRSKSVEYYYHIVFPKVPIVQFIVDRPFAFFIKIGDVIVLAGRVLDPRKDISL